MNIEAQKLNLAQKLPDQIRISTLAGRKQFHWISNGNLIGYHEWLYVVYLLEKTLNSSQCDEYGMMINVVMAKHETSHILSICDWHASFEERSEALHRVFNIWEE